MLQESPLHQTQFRWQRQTAWPYLTAIAVSVCVPRDLNVLNGRARGQLRRSSFFPKSVQAAK
jgi:hypothetical protein